MKNIIKITIFIFIFQFAAQASELTDRYAKLIKSMGLSSFIKYTSQAMNEDCPMTIDEHTTLMSVLPYSDRLAYQVRIKMPLERLQPAIKELKKRISTIGTKQVCTSEGSRYLINAGVVIDYEYYANDGHFLFKYSVSPGSCE